MNKVTVNSQSIIDFGNKIKEEGSKLTSILDSMKKDSILYSDMVDSDAGNLYKEVMLLELEKEKKHINESTELVANKFLWIAGKYNDTTEEINKKVGYRG